jgi:type VI secretion system secreted protein VgrG
MSLYQQLLAALSGVPTQNERLLRLRTPLGAEVLLAEKLSLQEHIGPAPQTAAGFRAEVFALAADTHIELKSLIGQPALLELELADASLRPWHGHITQAALVGSDGGLARYRLVIEPWLSFLAQRQDSWVFQGQSVKDIIDEVFADYQAQGKLTPAYRWSLADEAVYAERSLCIQYQETDLAFVQRLLLEEGLYCWWEHSAGSGDTLGTHTLVIADHDGAFTPCKQPRVRYTQASASLKEDSLTRWRGTAAVHTAALHQASQDYRSNGAAVALREQTQTAVNAAANLAHLSLTDIPGLYAYEDSAQGQRLALRQMQALDALRRTARASGTLRQAAPGTQITLAEHPLHRGKGGGNNDADRFTILAVHHKARSNLRADHKAQVMSLLGAIQSEQADHARGAPGLANASEEPVYSSTLHLQPAAVPVRMARLDANGQAADLPDVRLHPRPSVHGVQTALVVGTGEPVHTDRDHRIKVQFHWQRGQNASHRLDHNAGSNAPATDQAGTWVRVSEAWAGANWGANFIPRVGQEVMVGFIGGDIDRPVVIGAVYNGQGQANAQSNQAGGGAAGSTGDAPAWFPGDKAKGQLQAHQHNAVLAGHKSQELASSASGSGGHNQLVFDDSPGAGRIELSTTSAATRLQLGQLLLQTDNQRLNPRGHWADLHTQAWGSLRAGSGLLISAHARAGGSLGTSMQIDTREPQAQLDQARELAHTLAESAHKHKAKLTAEPDVIGATEKDQAKQLPFEQGFFAGLASLVATVARGEPKAGEAANDQAPAKQAEDEQQFDEQLIFVNAKGAVLSSVGYAVTLADGSKHSGTTDAQGRTSRIVTDSAQQIKEVTLKPKDMPCCAAHAQNTSSADAPLTFEPKGVATNSQDVGRSTQQVATPEGKSRGLTSGEIEMARLLFKGSVDYGKVKIHNGEYLWLGMQPDNTAMTPNGEMYFNPGRFKEDFSASASFGDRLWFMHEMVHVWQYQLGYPVKWRGAMRVGLSYEYELAEDKTCADYNMEAQGNLLADYWAEVLVGSPPALWQDSSRGQAELLRKVLAKFIANPADVSNLPGGQ